MRKRKCLAAVLAASVLSLSLSASVFAEIESPAESSAPAAEAESETEIDLGELSGKVSELENRLSAIEGVLPAAADCARGNGALKASTLKEFEILSAFVRLRAEASKADAERSELEFRLISALVALKAEELGIVHERPSLAGGTESEIFGKGYSCFDDFSARNGSDSPSVLDGEKIEARSEKILELGKKIESLSGEIESLEKCFEAGNGE